MAVTTYAEKVPGENVVPLKELFQSSRIPETFNVGADITSATIAAQYQCNVWTGVTIDTITGQYNFANATHAGYFAKVDITLGDVPTIVTASTGDCQLIVPENMYSGKLNPNVRDVCVIASIGVAITDTDSFDTTLRFDYMLTYEPDASDPGDPRLDAGYTAYVSA